MQQWYQCHRCSTAVAFGARFCGNCGIQLNWPAQQQMQPPPQYQQQVQPPPPQYQQQQQPYYQQQGAYGYQQETSKQQSSPWLMVTLLLGILAIIIGVAAFIPIMEVPYTVTALYYENEPYEATETYTESVLLSYEATNYVKDDVVVQRYETHIPPLPPMVSEEVIPVKVASVDIRNTDNIAGNFTVRFSGFNPMFGSASLTTTLTLSPGELKTTSCPADSDVIGDWSYNVTPSTKQVEKERTVTKYEQVEKEGTETHYKKVSIFEYLRSSF